MVAADEPRAVSREPALATATFARTHAMRTRPANTRGPPTRVRTPAGDLTTCLTTESRTPHVRHHL